MRTPTSPRGAITSALRSKFALPDARTLLLVAGDGVSFVVFAAVGRTSHGEASGLGAMAQVIGTAIPFALGWFLIAPFLGAYRRSLTEQPLGMFKRAELAWMASWPVAMLLRWLSVADHRSFATFAVVVLITNAILLGGWRTTFSFIARGRRSGPGD